MTAKVCNCKHLQDKHHNGRGMCSGRTGGFICSCSRFKTADAAESFQSAMTKGHDCFMCGQKCMCTRQENHCWHECADCDCGHGVEAHCQPGTGTECNECSCARYTPIVESASEEAAWQNAAESLPAQPGYERCDNCDGAISQGPQGWVHEDSDERSCERADPGEPVVPVEAKEKCERCGQPKDDGWRHNYQSGYGDFSTISCSAPAAEPKPTPSTPLEPKTHDLKVWPEYYRAIIEGRKFFEIRKNDRDYKVGDLLTLREFNPDGEGNYTGYYTTVEVAYILYGGSWGLSDDMCVMSIVKPGQVGSTGDDIHVQRVVMGVCERAWAAAKGQNNGR